MAYLFGDRLRDVPDPTGQFVETSIDRDMEVALFSFVNEDRFDVSRKQSARMEFDKGIVQDTAFYMGYQNSLMDKMDAIVRPKNKKNKRGDEPANVLQDFVKTVLSMYIQASPRFRSVPASVQEVDKLRARMCDTLLDYVWAEQELDLKTVDLLTYREVQRLSWLKVLWDENAGDLQRDPNSGEPLVFQTVDGNGRPILEYRPEGNFVISVVGPQSMFWEPGAKNFQDSRWCVEASVRPVDRIAEDYGVDMEGDEGISTAIGESISAGGFYMKGLDGEQSYASTQAYLDSSSKTQFALVLEYWEIPSVFHPQGRYIACAGKTAKRVLAYREFPFGHGKLPYVAFPAQVNPWAPYPTCTLTQLSPVVKRMNRLTTLLESHAKKAIRPPVLIPRGAQLNVSQLSNGTEVIEYNAAGGPAPQPLQMPAQTSTAIGSIGLLQDLFQTISGLAPVTHGLSTTGVRTFTQQAALAESVERKQLPAHRIYEKAMEQFGRMVLELAREKMPATKVLRILGSGGQWEFTQFETTSIADSVDVRVQVGASLAKSRAQETQLVLELMGQNFFGLPPALQERLARLISFDQAEALLDPRQSRFKADMLHEMEELKKGVPLDAMPLQDHVAYIDELGSFMGSWEYRQLQRTNPVAFGNIEIRYNQHVQWFMASQQAFMAQSATEPQAAA